MAETNQAGIRRARRSTEASRRLARARARNAAQLAEHRDAEKRVDAALREYLATSEKIADAEQKLADKLAEQDRVRLRLAEQTERKVAAERHQQARAALTIHESGRTVEQVADLLEVSVKVARALIAAGREADDTAQHADTADAEAEAARRPEPTRPLAQSAGAPSSATADGVGDAPGEPPAPDTAGQPDRPSLSNKPDTDTLAAPRGIGQGE
jgi:hypothetical protein